MSELFEQIKTDWITARKNGDAVAKNLLTTLYSDLKNLSFSANRTTAITDHEVLPIIKKYLDNARENLALYEGAEIKDSVELFNTEISILEKYMPQQMTAAELESAIREILPTLTVSGPKALGPIMAYLKSKHFGTYDQKSASEIAKTVLNS
jgi:uncharacterized protein YqeY